MTAMSHSAASGDADPVMPITLAPLARAMPAISTIERVRPVFEITTATSPGCIIEAIISCWWESVCAPQGTPNSGNFCWASRATMPDAP